MTQQIKLDNTYLPWGLRVAAGRQRNQTQVIAIGQNAAIGTAGESFWPAGAAYTWQAAAAILDITSTDVDDQVADTGASTIIIEGLDADFVAISESVTLTAQTAALTVNSYLRVNAMYVTAAGSSLANEGIIYASTGAQTAGTPDVATTIRATIVALGGASRAAIYTVPAGKVAYVSRVFAATAEVTDVLTVTLHSRTSGGLFVVNDLFTILANTIQIKHDVPLVFAAGTDLELFGDAAANTVDATGGFDLVLLDA